MILLLGKNELIEMAEELFSELKKEGLEPNTRAFAEMIGAYMQVGMIEKAMETYESMKASGCAPDRLTFMILIRNLEKAR
jgi:chitinase